MRNNMCANFHTCNDMLISNNCIFPTMKPVPDPIETIPLYGATLVFLISFTLCSALAVC